MSYSSAVLLFVSRVSTLSLLHAKRFETAKKERLLPPTVLLLLPPPLFLSPPTPPSPF